jgi:hypothetical protein
MSLNAFNKLPKEKRNELILVVVITIAILAGLGFGLIGHQKTVLKGLEQQKKDQQSKLDHMQSMIKLAPQTQTELVAKAGLLDAQEATMASGDLFSWFIGVLRPFKQNYRVDIPQIGTPEKADMNLLPKFPYQQATLSLAGTARFHELGRFLADLENQFPHARLLNLDVEPSSSTTEKDLLSFRVDLVMLVKPGSS